MKRVMSPIIFYTESKSTRKSLTGWSSPVRVRSSTSMGGLDVYHQIALGGGAQAVAQRHERADFFAFAAVVQAAPKIRTESNGHAQFVSGETGLTVGQCGKGFAAGGFDFRRIAHVGFDVNGGSNGFGDDGGLRGIHMSFLSLVQFEKIEAV